LTQLGGVELGALPARAADPGISSESARASPRSLLMI